MDTSNSLLSRNSSLKKSSGIALTALLIFGAVAGVMAYSPGNALAQSAITITTSADQFYGNSLLQVIVVDSAKNSASGTQETTSVNVSVKSDTGATVAGPTAVSAREIGANSGQFEFFIATLNGHDPAASRSEATAANAAVLRANANPSGNANDATLTVAGNVDKNYKFVIEYVGATTKEVLFNPTSATFTLDRTTAGSNNNVIFQLTDRDANRDPTAIDTITGTIVANATHNAVYLDVNGGGVMASSETLISSQSGVFSPHGGAFTLTETGANTNVFEATQSVGTVTTDSTRTYQLTNFDVYSPFSGNRYNVTSTAAKIDQSLVLRNTDGSITPITQLTFASEIPITLNDADRNLSTRSTETITATSNSTHATAGVVVSVDGAFGTERENVNMKETGDNTGVFRPDLSNNVLPVTFLSNAGTPTPNNGILELTAADINGNTDIVIQYFDVARSNQATGAISSTIRLPITHVAGQLSFNAPTVQQNQKITVTLNDRDLNNNPNTPDSFTVTTSTSSNTFPLTINGISYTNIADFAMTIKGSSTTFSSQAQTITFIETNATSGIFTGQLDVAKIATSFNDGDKVELKYIDKMESATAPAESTASFTIGKPATSITVDRTAAPLPLTAVENGSSSADSVKVRLTIVDSTKNTDSSVQETIASSAIDLGTAANDISATQSDGTTAVTIGTSGQQINYNAFSLTETTPNSGIFSGQVTLTRGTGTIAQLDNARIKFTWDSNSATVTLRPNDLAVATNKSVVVNGDTVTVTITDADRNLDPEAKDTVSFTMQTQSDTITTGGSLTTTAEETAPNSGIFTKNVTIGTDIKVTSVGTTTTQAREIKITATDRVASDRTTAVVRELVIAVSTSSGTLTVTPEVVGPGTKLTVLVTDADLNANPSGTETITGATTEYITITTDRTNFPSTKAGAEETGPNTGQFKTTIKLKPLAGTIDTPTGAGSKDIADVEVLPGDLLSIRYVDAKTSTGVKTTVSKVIQVVSVDPKMNSSKTSYAVGETITVSVTDADANRDGEVIDSLKVKVTSEIDQVGFDVTGLETGVNTGVFTFSIPTTTTVSAGSITVGTGSQVKVKYTDTYPADYADRVKQVVDPSKDFFINIPIGSIATNTSTTPTSPALLNLDGSPVTEITSGQQVVVGTTVRNNDAQARPITVLIEVRDSDGITVLMSFQRATVAGNGTIDVGTSWLPETPGQYQTRTFVVTSLDNPQALSGVVTSNVTVS